MPFHTDLGVVFEALGGRQNEFNWLVTDLEFGNLDAVELPMELTLRLGRTTYEFPDVVWLTGKRFSEIIDGYNLQFIWAVLSGFDPHIEIDPNNLEALPSADGNSGFWREGVSIQHPRASVEIVCWDSSYTLLLSKDDDLTKRFRDFFPEACDLDAYNRGKSENCPRIG